MKIQFALVFVLNALFFHFHAQQNVDWGEFQKKSGYILQSVPGKNNELFELKQVGTGAFGSYKLFKYVNFEVAASAKVSVKVDQGMGNIERMELIGHRLFVFLTDRREGQLKMFIQEYSTDDLTPIGGVNNIISYTLEKGINRVDFSIISSDNQNYFAVIWVKNEKKDEKDAYGFKVMNSNLDVINEGEYKVPFSSKYSNIEQHYISNNGDYFIHVDEFEDGDQKVFKKELNYKASHLMQLTNEGIEDFTINLEGKRIEDMMINSDNSNLLLLTGVYGENRKEGIDGIFYLKIDFNKKQIVKDGFEKFPTDFITENWTERQKKKAQKRVDNGKDEPALYDYVFRQAEVLKDGSIVGSLERYYTRVVSSYNAQTQSYTNTTYYYYTNLIAFKIGANGGFEWMKHIPKYQVSTNDGGYFSSYARFVENGNLCFILNDNRSNYDENGNSLDLKTELDRMTLSKKNNVAGIVKIDLSSGEITREIIFDRNVLGIITVPRNFTLDKNNKQIWLYGQYKRKEKYGTYKLVD